MTEKIKNNETETLSSLEKIKKFAKEYHKEVAEKWGSNEIIKQYASSIAAVIGGAVTYLAANEIGMPPFEVLGGVFMITGIGGLMKTMVDLAIIDISNRKKQNN